MEAGLAVDVEVLVATTVRGPEMNAEVGDTIVLDTWGSPGVEVAVDGRPDTESVEEAADIGSFAFPVSGAVILK